MAICNLTGQSSVTSNDDYVYPSDWIDIRNPALGTMELLVADEGNVSIYVQVSSGNYVGNWGDGTASQVFASKSVASKVYPKGGGQACDRGYTTYKITITPETGNLVAFRMDSNSDYGINNYPNILACVTNSSTLESLVDAFYKSSSPTVNCKLLEYYKAIQPVSANNTYSNAFYGCGSLQSVEIHPNSQITSVVSMFYGCTSLKKYVLPNVLTNITDASNMFRDCVSLQQKNINTDAFINVTNASYMFSGVVGLTDFDASKMTLLSNATSMFSGTSIEKIDLSPMTSVTTMSNMFNSCRKLRNCVVGSKPLVTSLTSSFSGCPNLKEIDISGVVNTTDLNSTFMYNYNLKTANISGLTKVEYASMTFLDCYSLESLTTTNFSSSATSLEGGVMFSNAKRIQNINLSSAKIKRIHANGTTSNLNALQTLTFSASSLFGGTAPQIDISYNNLSATQINTIFTALPTVSAKTIKITGCTGTATCTTSIATAKGWTVTTT